jgi:hypothetical protein
MSSVKALNCRFARAAELMGWDTSPAYRRGSNLAYVGATFLTNMVGAGWAIEQIIHPRGGERRLYGRCGRAEMWAWLGGIIFAKETQQ